MQRLLQTLSSSVSQRLQLSRRSTSCEEGKSRRDAENGVGGDNQHISDAYNGALTIVCWCCSHLFAIGDFNLRANSIGVANSVADITSS